MSTNKKVSVSLLTISIVAFFIVSVYLSMVYIKLKPSDTNSSLIESLNTQHNADSVQLETYKSEIVQLQSELSEAKVQLKSFRDSVGYELRRCRDSITALNR